MFVIVFMYLFVKLQYILEILDDSSHAKLLL